MKVGDQKGNIVALGGNTIRGMSTTLPERAHKGHGREENTKTYRDRLSPQDDKPFSSHRHEPGKLFTQDSLNLIGLLDGNGQPDRVDGRFNEDAFVFVSADLEWLEDDLLGCADRKQDTCINR